MKVQDNKLYLPETGEMIAEDIGGGYKGRMLIAANDSRFDASQFSEPLTTFGVGWTDSQGVQDSLDFIAPPIESNRWAQYKKATNANQFHKDSDITRAIGSDFKRVEDKQTDQSQKIPNTGLTYIGDLDEEVGNWQPARVAWLLGRIMRSEFYVAKGLLSGASTNTAKTWDPSAGKDPDQDVMSELISGKTASGVMPNRVIYGHTAWAKRILAHGAQTTASGFRSAGFTPEQLAAWLNVEGVRISKELYQSSASAKTDIMGNLVIAFQGQQDPMKEDPTNLKRFVSVFSAEQGGGRVRVYEQQISAKLVALTVEMYSLPVLTSTLGIRQLTIS